MIREQSQDFPESLLEIQRGTQDLADFVDSEEFNA
jgi:hypothetical protein